MCYNLLNGQKGRCGMGVKFTSESEMERSLINELVSGVSQWTYRADLKSEADLWNNFKNKLENNPRFANSFQFNILVQQSNT